MLVEKGDATGGGGGGGRKRNDSYHLLFKGGGRSRKNKHLNSSESIRGRVEAKRKTRGRRFYREGDPRLEVKNKNNACRNIKGKMTFGKSRGRKKGEVGEAS